MSTQNDISQSADNERFGRLPWLDGLRAVAILLVLGVHSPGPLLLNIGRRHSGWAGVHIFFVISGFLITSILLQEQKDTGRFSFRRFYIRRTLRIWPVFYFFLIVSVITTHYPSAVVATTATFLTDYQVVATDDWGQPFSGCWSLAVEEQFYLLWPLILFFSGRSVLRVVIGLIFAVWLWRAFLLVACHASVVRIYFAFDTEADCLLYGCLAAILWSDGQIRAKIREYMSSPIVPFIAACCLFFSIQALRGHSKTASIEERIYMWCFLMPLFEIVVSILLLSLLVQPRSYVAGFLGSRPMRWIGRISFSLYLWQFYVLEYAPELIRTIFTPTRWLHEVGIELTSMLLTICVSALSYYLIEKPFLRLKTRWENKPSRINPKCENSSNEFAGSDQALLNVAEKGSLAASGR